MTDLTGIEVENGVVIVDTKVCECYKPKTKKQRLERVKENIRKQELKKWKERNGYE